MESRIRLFGTAEERLREQLADMLDSSVATLSYAEGEGVLTLSADPDTVEDMTDTVLQRLGFCVYSLSDESLEQRVVELLTHHGKTVATAESCTGGLISARLTGVPGSSRVFGTGVVSYAPDCKQKMLGVSPDTLAAEGTVCAAVAGQMARGVRRAADADIGVAVTGEAGPQAAEAVPVGTVFIALADAKRTWVCELHLEGDRQSIRRQAAGQVLFLLYRYLEAYPTVMAGGTSNRVAQRTIPHTQGTAHPRLLSRLLPWRGDSWRAILIKCAVWLLVLSLLVGGVALIYRYLLLAPDNNRQLQDALGDLYWSTDLTEDTDKQGAYPQGMLAQFRGLYDRNRDIAGWVQIPDTSVDYPVMFYNDGYYKNHNFNYEYSLYGQPYFIKDTQLGSRTTEYPLLVIYGKNTGDGQMFSDLLNYRRVAYLQEHPVIEMNTVVEAGRWEIFAVLVADERRPEECNYAQTGFDNEKAYATYLEMLQERSLFTSDQPVTTRDRVLLLSVNAEDVYRYSAARLVIAARWIDAADSQAVYRRNHGAQLPAVLTTTARTTGRTTSSSTANESTTTSVPSSTTTTKTQSTTATTVATDDQWPDTTTSTTETGTTTGGESTVPSQGEDTQPTQNPSDREELPEEAEGESYDYIGD